MGIVWLYLLGVNLAAFLLMGFDKYQAQHGGWRVPEKTLFLLPLLGGGVGGTLGMTTFRHKTRHWYFRLLFPCLAVLQLVAIVYIGGGGDVQDVLDLVNRLLY